ncbi:hypothetical protein L195_g014884 [Trifolium pratense]|uniref:Uncharacterized protein n=1 Tax=Trifolium pratense TaxID=57577 RepID=A0A2K3PS80_TRIPR|nr:hypothetical protein L195_g014884 [Trifolium pratense]
MAERGKPRKPRNTSEPSTSIRVRSRSPSLVTIPIVAKSDVRSLETYMASLPSPSIEVILAARKHLVSRGWRVKKDVDGVFFLLPDKDRIEKLADACSIELGNQPEEDDQKKLKENQEEVTNKNICGQCNNEVHPGELLEKILWNPVDLGDDIQCLLMRSDRDIPELTKAKEILYSSFGRLLTDRLLIDFFLRGCCFERK